MQRRHGFTIVELLIVIVVIAILAAISTVVYAGVQNRASVAAIQSEAMHWKKLFEVYKATNGSYPPLVASGDASTSGGPGSGAQNAYCLGTGFPVSSSNPYCYVVNSASSLRVHESTGSYVLTQLNTVGTPPLNSKKYVYGSVVGPRLHYYHANSYDIITTFPPGTTCPTGMLTGSGDSTRQDCYYTLR